MNPEISNQVPVAEQLNEIEETEEAIDTEYALASDGTISRVEQVPEIG